MPSLPLEGIRILDSTYFFALRHAGGHPIDEGQVRMEVKTVSTLAATSGIASFQG